MAKRVKTVPLQNSTPATSVSPRDAGYDDQVERLERQLVEVQEVVKRLEHGWKSSEGTRTRQEGPEATDQPHQHAISVGLFKGKGVRTFYYGPSSPGTIVANVGPYHTGS